MTAGLRVVREAWHGRDVLSYPDRPPSILHILDRAIDRHGDRTGLVDPGGRCTYAAFGERVAGTAAALRNRGLGGGAAIGVVGPNSLDLATVVFACASAGAVMVGLSERAAVPRWASLLRTTGARAIVAAPGHAAAAAAAAAAAGLHDDAVIDLAELTHDRTAPWRVERTDERGTYAVVGTAGTTGEPKASRVVHRCSVHSAMSYADVLELTPRDRTAVLFPLTYISALHAHVLPTMLAGGTTVLTARVRAHHFCNLLADERITWMYTVPSQWLALLRVERFTAAHLPSLRVAAFGGSHMPPDLLPAIRKRLPEVALLNIYGLSETHSPATILRDHEFARRPASVGRPLPCMEARVVAEDGRVLRADAAGELQLRGSLVTTGYVGAADATSAAFGADGWFSTGDQARMDAEGYVWILGRRRDLIIRGGFNIAPAEVEHALRLHPGVADVAVYGLDAAAGDQVVACAIVLSDPTVGVRDVRRWVRDHVADYAMPRHVRFLDELPLTAIGKIDRRALVAAAWGRLSIMSADADAPPPRDVDDAVDHILDRYRSFAVVGASPRSWRPSNGVMQTLAANGYAVIPINPTCDEVLGRRTYPDLASAAEAHPIEVVDIFRRADRAGAHVDEAIAVGARAVWLQLGVIDEAAAQRARDAGLAVVMDRCPAIELRRRGGG